MPTNKMKTAEKRRRLSLGRVTSARDEVNS